MQTTALLPSAYFGPVQYYQKFVCYKNCLIEQHEHFVKQTYRSRCNIYSPNGTLTLSIPLAERNKRQIIKDVKISYDFNWQVLHWRSIESSYRRSPFFEFYEDDLRFIFEKKFTYLLDINETAHQKISELIKLNKNYIETNSYKDNYDDTDDYRKLITPKTDFTSDKNFILHPYYQVFQTKHGFIPNLSVLDLLFNQGSKAINYLQITS